MGSREGGSDVEIETGSRVPFHFIGFSMVSIYVFMIVDVLNTIGCHGPMLYMCII